jgi:hypothetical protein
LSVALSPKSRIDETCVAGGANPFTEAEERRIAAAPVFTALVVEIGAAEAERTRIDNREKI